LGLPLGATPYAIALPRERHYGTPQESPMSSHPTDYQGSVIDALRKSIEESIPNSKAEVLGGGGHYQLDVVSPEFAGKGLLDRQRLVYSAISHLMKGDAAPVHAVDSLKTRTPETT